jgi:RNA recognition motif-containing protein
MSEFVSGSTIIVFDEADAAKRAVAEANGLVLRGRQLVVKPYEKRESIHKSDTNLTRTLFVVLSREATDADLNAVFRNLPGLVDVRVACNKENGWFLGYCHADFVNTDAARDARTKLRGLEVLGKPVIVKSAKETYLTQRRIEKYLKEKEAGGQGEGASDEVAST